jgi:2TM family of unknown function (DUF5676)
MKIDSRALGLAFAVTATLIWVICSLLVVAMPNEMMSMSGSMFHADFANAMWTMTIVGFVVGLVIWTTTAFAIGWLVGAFYNKFARN